MASPESVVNSLIGLDAKNGPLVAAPQRAKLIASWGRAKEQIMKGNWRAISGFLVDLRRTGVKLPLEMTLIFKNMNALQQMARKAGFDNLVEAYLYTPPPGAVHAAPADPTPSPTLEGSERTEKAPARTTRRPGSRSEGGPHKMIMLALRSMPMTFGATIITALLTNALHLPAVSGLGLIMLSGSVSFVLEQGWLFPASHDRSSTGTSISHRLLALAA
jgi:hypothetical protein